MVNVVEPAAVSWRRADGGVVERRPWLGVDPDEFKSSLPWRTFRWSSGQKHYSGTYWSSTMGGHVIYESRLELTRLIYADFDPVTTAVYAQPFLLSVDVDGAVRRHVPDFLIVREGDVPLVVDVKPARLLARSTVRFSLGWARDVVDAQGWEFQIWTEPPQDEMANLRFLAGYRREWLFDRDLLDEIRGTDLWDASLGEAFHAFPGRARELVRSAVLHLLWRQHWSTNLNTPLSARHTLGRSPATVVGSGARDLPAEVAEPGGHAGPEERRPARRAVRSGGGA